MLKVAICDDSLDIVIILSNWIDLFCQQKNYEYMVDTFSNGIELVEKNTFYNIIFLDIDMPKMNGLQAAKEIRKWDKDVFIIYVTSYPDYKNFAFSVHAFGYIQKPVEKKSVYYYLNETINYSENKKNQKILNLKTNDGILRVNANSIYYFEFWNRKTKIVSENGEHLSAYAIGQVYEKLSAYGFEMPHKSFVVNMLQVKNIAGFEIEMMNGDIVPLAQKKAVYFKNKLNDCLQSTFEMI